ncbi:DNA-binding protein [Flavobacterium cheongpyeongense]|uniref:DNA-binding protein n=1 Tax=Flavobacterium cheongpyeongense TaxID=2212651 RepID=A0A2V4BL97_9FLAO|nr:DNA-binding protein [Flavobacterium cheongpyeongense]PXY39611.1 DNA-binding protein [Flavobacterium cheongpyeongense]
MKKDLTMSSVDRQNILNNAIVLENIQEHIGVNGMYFNGEYRFTKSDLSDFYGIDGSTIDRYLSNNEEELKHNGYVNLKGKLLKEFKAEFGWMLQEGAKAPQLGVFNFRAFLNLGMLLTESEKAKALRSVMLDIVIDTLNQKVGGSTKYINQRDEDFLVAITREPIYRKEFTNALNLYLEMGNYKYAAYTDSIYEVIFHENSKEYKQILQLEEKENPRDTMYSEVLKLIASFEIGIADEMKKKFDELKRKLLPKELDKLILDFANQRFWGPQLEDVRTKMACRDYGLRNIIHERLKPYINTLNSDEYNRFLGDKSKSLIERVMEDDQLLEIFKRLKDR